MSNVKAELVIGLPPNFSQAHGDTVGLIGITLPFDREILVEQNGQLVGRAINLRVKFDRVVADVQFFSQEADPCEVVDAT